jgi:hypothetical protein
LNDPELYEALSVQSEHAWKRIQLPVSMGALLEAWIADSPAQSQWIRDHSLLSGLYRERISR